MNIEAWVEQEILLTCNNCNDDIYNCSRCDKEFVTGERVYCNENSEKPKHYCENCKDAK